MRTFFLGTHMPLWLGTAGVELCVSRRRLIRPRRTIRAKCDWMLDSSGFTEIAKHGRWLVSADQYADEVMAFGEEIGKLRLAAIQDWMCEPQQIAKTGLSVADHQRLTVASYLELRDKVAGVYMMPVVQGWTVADYVECVSLYGRAGVDLAALPAVGLGSVCRRQAMGEALAIVSELASMGIKLHAFGFKKQGIAMCGHLLESADSMAWSVDARYGSPMEGCQHGMFGGGNCANCLRYAMYWRNHVLGWRQQL